MENEFRILMLEDMATDAALVEWELRRAGLRFAARRVETEDDFRRELREFAPDLILSDYSLPSYDGLSALRVTLEVAPDIPFIMVTASVNEETAVACLKAGAADYILKDKLARLASAVSSALEKKRVAEEKARAEEELRLSREHLARAQKMEAVGRLAGGVAHDFNNLLTVILGFSHLVLGRLGPDHPLRAEVEQIRQAGERAAALTAQLLAFSRKQVAQARVINLGEVVLSVKGLLLGLVGEDVELTTAVEPGAGCLKADPTQVEQVIFNLAANARDAMPQGGHLAVAVADVDLGEPAARAHGAAPPGAYSVLSVSDTGCGMDAETRARIFEPFFTTKEQGKGTGLGLATVYGIVEQHGGFIRVESEPGAGTTFRVYFPRAAPAAGEAAPARAEQPEPLPRGTEVVLLVEDEGAVRRLTRELLEMQGYTVLEAAGGEEALRLSAEGGQIDLLLTDVVMPRLSGRELAERLSAERPHLKVLYFSGYTDDIVVRHGLLEHGLAFIQKPFSQEALLRKVREVLDRGRR
jgi:two-component system, cell cycle sensor histidine kinase and response regulator CckA